MRVDSSASGEPNVIGIGVARRTNQRADTQTTRVVLVDDCVLIRRALRDVLDEVGVFEVVGECGTYADAMATIAATDPDLIVLDVRMPDGNGIDLCEAMRDRRPDTVCVVLTAFEDDRAHLGAMRAGAAVLLKSSREDELVEALRRAAAGEPLIDAEVLRRVADRERASHRDAHMIAALSRQQRRVVELVGQGLTNREIADRMHLAEKTVKNYVSHILAALDMKRRTEVAALAARLDERERHQGELLRSG